MVPITTFTLPVNRSLKVESPHPPKNKKKSPLRVHILAKELIKKKETQESDELQRVYSKIFNLLSDADLEQVSRVCKSWNGLVVKLKRASSNGHGA